MTIGRVAAEDARRRIGMANDMADGSDRTTQIQRRLDRLRAGDDSARDELFEVARGRLYRLARRMLRGYPGVRRWEETDDVLQNAAVRLCRALGEVRPASVRSFLNLAAVQIRRELIDLARRYEGPRGLGGDRPTRVDWDAPGEAEEADVLATWTEFHERVEALPDLEREAFDLLWYQGLTQAKAADVLGVTERVVKWRWRSAKLKIHEALGGFLPGT